MYKGGVEVTDGNGDTKETKRYYWLKLKRDFFKRHDIQIIEDIQPNGKEYVLFYLKLMVESIDHDGELRFSDTIPYNAQMLATITRTNIDIVRSALKVLAEFGMIEILSDKTIYMTAVENMIGSAANNDNANRQRRFREKQKQLALSERYDSVTKNNESKSIELQKDIDKDKEKEKTVRFNPPTVEEVSAYIHEKQYHVDAESFIAFYQSKGWKVGNQPMKDWKSAVVTWEKRELKQNKQQKSKPKGNQLSEEMTHSYDMDELRRRAKE